MKLGQLDTLSSVLSVLTALIAPALLMSACGTFIISTAHRLALNTERARALVVQLWKLEAHEHEGSAARLDRRVRLERQLDLAFGRVLLQQRALALFYAAAVLFVSCSLTLGMDAVTQVLPAWLPIALGLAGVVLLLTACALLLDDVRRLVAGMKDEIAEVRRR